MGNGGGSLLPDSAISVHRCPRKHTGEAHLGISTPGRHSSSRSPKYSVPSIYCNGFPVALSSTRRSNTLFWASPSPGVVLRTCSVSHRSSFFAEVMSSHGSMRRCRRRLSDGASGAIGLDFEEAGARRNRFEILKNGGTVLIGNGGRGSRSSRRMPGGGFLVLRTRFRRVANDTPFGPFPTTPITLTPLK
jgi:hypothetical protein